MIIFFAFVSTSCLSQAAEPKAETKKSNLEEFYSQTGTLIKKEYHRLGKASGVEISAVTITNTGNQKLIKGIRLETSIQKSYGSSSKIAFLDSDEIEGFIKSANLLQELNEVNSNDTEYQYESRSGFQSGAFTSKDKWKYFLKLDKYDSDSYVFLERDNFQKLLDIISQYKP